MIYSETPTSISCKNRLSAPLEVVDELNQLMKESMLASPENCVRTFDLLEELRECLVSQCASEQQASFINELFSLCLSRLEAEIEFVQTLSPQQLEKRSHSQMLGQSRLSFPQLMTLRLITGLKRRQLSTRANRGLRSRKDLTVDSGLTVFMVQMLFQIYFRSSPISRELRDYFPVPVKVTGVAIEHSATGSTWWMSSSPLMGTPDTNYVHIDEALESPKAILYLSEVSERNGPTEFFPGLLEVIGCTPLQKLIGRVIGNIGSNPNSPLHDALGTAGQRSSSYAFRNLFWSLPDSVRFNSHFGWDVPHGHPLIAEINKRRSVVTGRAGTFSVFDGGRVAHRGGLIQDGERCVLQIVFATNTKKRNQGIA